MKFGTSKLLISAAVAIAFPSLSNAAPFFSHVNDASPDDLSQNCSDFQITSPSSTAALDWTPGSLQTISWEAPSSYSSVSIALLDSNNQTISDFGTYDASQGNTGQKEISLQGHPSGLYHLKFTALKADGECEIDSDPIRISSGSDSSNNASPSTTDLDDIFSKFDSNTSGSSTTAPANEELDDIFNNLNNHDNDEGWHVDEDEIEVPSVDHSDAITDLVNDIENGDLSGWHSNEDDVEENDFSGWHSDDVDGTPSFGHSDAITDLVNDIENGDLSGWHSNENDIEEIDFSGWHSDDANENGTPTFGHSDAITDLVNDIENDDLSGWHTDEADVDDGNNSGEPQSFEELIESLDQPYDQYLDKNNASENQPLTTHKNDADVGSDAWTTEDDTTGDDSDISAQLDEIFSKLAGNGSGSSEQPTTGDDVHSDMHWNSEDGTNFTDEYSGVPPVDDTTGHDDAGWHEDEADVDGPTTDSHSDDDPQYKWDGDGTANANHVDETPNTWFTEDHSDEALPTAENDATPNKWFTDVHNDEIVPPIVDDVPGVHADEVEVPGVHADDDNSKWFTDVHNDEIVPPIVDDVPGVHADEVEVPGVHADDDNSKWFTDVHNDEIVPPVTDDVPGVHADDVDANTWFTDVHNDEVETPGTGDVEANKWFTDVHSDEVVPPAPAAHADDVETSKWFTDVHNDEVVPPAPAAHADDVEASKWFTDVHNDEVVPPAPAAHADDAKWFTDVHVDDEVPQAHGNDAERWFSN